MKCVICDKSSVMLLSVEDDEGSSLYLHRKLLLSIFCKYFNSENNCNLALSQLLSKIPSSSPSKSSNFPFCLKCEDKMNDLNDLHNSLTEIQQSISTIISSMSMEIIGVVEKSYSHHDASSSTNRTGVSIVTGKKFISKEPKSVGKFRNRVYKKFKPQVIVKDCRTKESRLDLSKVRRSTRLFKKKSLIRELQKEKETFDPVRIQQPAVYINTALGKIKMEVDYNPVKREDKTAAQLPESNGQQQKQQPPSGEPPEHSNNPGQGSNSPKNTPVPELPPPMSGQGQLEENQQENQLIPSISTQVQVTTNSSTPNAVSPGPSAGVLATVNAEVNDGDDDHELEHAAEPKPKNRDGDKFMSCPDCPFRTKYFSNLKRHELIHRNEFLFGCNLCPYKAIQKCQVALHFTHNHSNIRKHPCPNKSCSYAAKTKGDLEKHKRRRHKNSKN